MLDFKFTVEEFQLNFVFYNVQVNFNDTNNLFLIIYWNFLEFIIIVFLKTHNKLRL
jgi:hypothetical protein